MQVVSLYFVLQLRGATHRVHPIAGQGVNLGFGDVLTDSIVQAARSGSNLGSMAHLVDCEKCRQRGNVPLIGSCYMYMVRGEEIKTCLKC